MKATVEAVDTLFSGLGPKTLKGVHAADIEDDFVELDTPSGFKEQLGEYKNTRDKIFVNSFVLDTASYVRHIVHVSGGKQKGHKTSLVSLDHTYIASGLGWICSRIFLAGLSMSGLPASSNTKAREGRKERRSGAFMQVCGASCLDAVYPMFFPRLFRLFFTLSSCDFRSGPMAPMAPSLRGHTRAGKRQEARPALPLIKKEEGGMVHHILEHMAIDNFHCVGIVPSSGFFLPLSPCIVTATGVWNSRRWSAFS